MALDNLTADQADVIDNHYPGFFQARLAAKTLAAIDAVNAQATANAAAVLAAETAETNAETAQGLAEGARDAAVVAQAAAEAVATQAGIIPLGTIDLGTNPTTGDTLLVGATTIEYKAAAEHVAADTNVAVEIGVDAAATFARVLAALNGTAADPHATILLKAPSALPAVGISAENILADDVAVNALRIVPATAPGGTPVAGPIALGLNAALTAAVSWSVSNLNKTLGVAAGTPQMAFGAYTITATEADAVFMPPFVPTFMLVSVQTSTGVVKVSGTGTVVIEGDHIIITKGDLTAGDVVRFILFG